MRSTFRFLARALRAAAAACLGVLAPVTLAWAQGDTPPRADGWFDYRVDGDAITLPLSAAAGDAARGRSIVADRGLSLCLLCHAAPIAEERSQGDIGPDLRSVGARFTDAQLRLRLVNARRLNPVSVMPPYFASRELLRVAPSWQGKPVLSAQQIEDVVAYLRTLRGSI
ncbi:MAG: sulfur oxidation c-type cytochrome SoxX [Burkholderiaceae bacterium]